MNRFPAPTNRHHSGIVAARIQVPARRNSRSRAANARMPFASRAWDHAGTEEPLK